jgi:hypothetical protein
MTESQSVSTQAIKPEYEAIKNKILEYYYNCIELTTLSTFKSHPQYEEQARIMLVNLSKSLAFKVHLIKDDQKIKYFKNFISSPHLYTSLDIEAVFSICSLIMELSGLNDVSTLTYSKKDSHLEVL